MNRTEAGPKLLDLNALSAADWPTSAFPLEQQQRRTAPQFVIRRSVWNAIHRHGLSRQDVEVCGVLVGRVLQDTSGPFVYIEASIAGEHAAQQLAQVTFTADTWEAIHATLERDHPERRILGWYHTHPGFGIFLSEMDLFIHRNFFGSPEQLAIVFDPVSGDEGTFLWRQGEPVREEILIEEDEPITAALNPDSEARATAVRSARRSWMWLSSAVLALTILAAAAYRYDLVNRFCTLWNTPVHPSEAEGVSSTNESKSR